MITSTATNYIINYNFQITTWAVAVAEAQVEGCDPGHGPGRCLHDQRAAFAVQQREERRHVRQPAARSPEHTRAHTHTQLRAGIKTHDRLGSNAAFNSCSDVCVPRVVCSRPCRSGTTDGVNTFGFSFLFRIIRNKTWTFTLPFWRKRTLNSCN